MPTDSHRDPFRPHHYQFCIAIPDADAEKILSTEDAISFIATHPQAK